MKKNKDLEKLNKYVEKVNTKEWGFLIAGFVAGILWKFVLLIILLVALIYGIMLWQEKRKKSGR